jgi:4-hydroxyphenylacetate 3-monooxygenase
VARWCADASASHAATRGASIDAESRASRVRLFRLAWDTCCSAFGTRQVLYERFFQADAVRNAMILHDMCDAEPMVKWVREFLEQD